MSRSCVPADEMGAPLYTLHTEEGSEILCGRKRDGSCAVHVSGPVGDSRGEYGGPEAVEVVEYAEDLWRRTETAKVAPTATGVAK